MTIKDLSKEDVFEILKEVKDPEIPVLSLVDLGVITDVNLSEEGLTVDMTPTFAGCPAMDYMVQDVKNVLAEKGIQNVKVNLSFRKPWTSDNLTEAGRRALKKFGLAPPPLHGGLIELDILEHIQCPYCDSDNTEMKTPFGPTLCRSMHYCHNCKQAFEQFKPV